jgi:L-asparagine oxygenase
LACLRNPSNVGTLVAGVRDFEFPEPLKQILFQNRFLHLTDNTHSEELSEPELLPILFGNQTSPYIRFDADFSVAQKGDSEAEHAIQYLHKQIQIHALEVDVEVGDFYFLDNYKWLHGRKPFRAHYDGKDRWIRRFNVKKDLKEAVNYRRSNNCRMLSAEPVVVE